MSGVTQCDLHIPYKRVGYEIPDLPPGAAAKLEENYLAIERWATHFRKNCVGTSGSGTPGSLVGTSYVTGFGDGTSETMVRPSYTIGDVFVACISSVESVGAHTALTDANITKPDGWTFVGQQGGGSAQQFLVYVKEAVSGEPANYDFNWVAAGIEDRYFRKWLGVLTNADATVNQLVGQTTNLVGSYSYTIPSIDVSQWSYVFRVAGSGADNIVSFDPEEGSVLIDDKQFGRDMIMRMYVQSNTGSTGTVVFTMDDNVVSGVMGISFEVGSSI